MRPDPQIMFTDRYDVNLMPDGIFSRHLGRENIRVNSLHGQSIDRDVAKSLDAKSYIL